MKSKLVLALLSLFICSSCLAPSQYLSVVPDTVSKGQVADYNFHFKVEKAIPYAGTLAIQFPNQYTDFGQVNQCYSTFNGGFTASGICGVTPGPLYTTVLVLEGKIDAGNYIVSIPGVLNPVAVDSSSNFRIFTMFYSTIYEESTDFEGMAFTDAPGT